MEIKDMIAGDAAKATGAGGAVYEAYKGAKEEGATGIKGVAGGTVKNLGKNYVMNSTAMGKAYGTFEKAKANPKGASGDIRKNSSDRIEWKNATDFFRITEGILRLKYKNSSTDV